MLKKEISFIRTNKKNYDDYIFKISEIVVLFNFFEAIFDLLKYNYNQNIIIKLFLKNKKKSVYISKIFVNINNITKPVFCRVLNNTFNKIQNYYIFEFTNIILLRIKT